MRLLLLNTSFPPMARSAAHLFYDLGCKLVARGFQVSVVTELPWRRLGSGEVGTKYPNGRFRIREMLEGMEVVRVRGFRFRENSVIGRGINALLVPITFYFGARSAVPKDVALVYSPPLTLGLAAFFLLRFHHVPFVFNVQDIYPQTPIELGLIKNPVLIRLSEWLERFIYSQAACIVVHSEGNRQYLITRRPLPPEKVVVIPNGVDTDLIRPLDRLNGFREEHGLGNRFLVCYAGTMGYAQDLTSIIQAARELQEYDDIFFLFIGEGARENEWKQKTARLGLGNVRFLPLQSKTAYPSVVGASDIGLVPLTQQIRTPVVPGKLLDFMAGARPVIATADLKGDTAKIIDQAKCGYALAPGDARGVAQAVLRLYGDRSLARQLGSNGRAYAEDHFSLGICAARYEELFKRIVAN